MYINFSPMRRDDALDLSVAGDTITINGEAFDFSAIPAGASLPREAISCEWIAGDVERDAAGVLTVPVTLPHGADAPEVARFPAPMADVPDGPVDLSAFAPEVEAEQ